MIQGAPLTMTEREAAREQLRASIDALAERADLHVQMQKEPVKMLGGASAVGALIGVVIGRQFRRSKRVYVDASSPVKHQKALIKAQTGKAAAGGGIGGALIATIGTLAVKTLTDRVITPRLEGLAESLLDRSGAPVPAARQATPARPAAGVAAPPVPAASVGVRATEPSAPVTAAPAPAVRAPAHPGVLPHPPSVVEAKAQGSEIPPEQMANPNRR